MSAFIVCDEHINAMLQAAAPKYAGDGASYRWSGEVYYFGGSTQKIGQKLLDENYWSVNYRYSESEQPRTLTGTPFIKTRSPGEIVAARDCYMYQACEALGWQESEAYAIAQALKQRAVRQVSGYGGTWEIRE